MGIFSTFFGSRTQEEAIRRPTFDWYVVQYQDRSGNWIDHESFPVGGTNPARFMAGASRAHPGKRIRVVDSQGAFVDNL